MLKLITTRLNFFRNILLFCVNRFVFFHSRHYRSKNEIQWNADQPLIMG